jgi:hypothetical protein
MRTISKMSVKKMTKNKFRCPAAGKAPRYLVTRR